MNTIEIDGYLVQEKLESALMAVVGQAAWRGREVQVVAGGRRRWDMVYEDSSGKVAVEFDGDEHYRHTLKIKADSEKDELARLAGYKVVRFPYWVQLTSETLSFYFGLRANIIQYFPHGFITTKVFPASFCELGIDRFRAELQSLPDSVRGSVVNSLHDRANEHGRKFVIPVSISELIG